MNINSHSIPLEVKNVQVLILSQEMCISNAKQIAQLIPHAGKNTSKKPGQTVSTHGGATANQSG